MKTKFFEMQYFETYYVANIISNLINGAFSEFGYLSLTSKFFGEYPEVFSKGFPRQSALHKYIKWVLDTYNHADLDSEEERRVLNGEHSLWIDIAFEHFGYKDTFKNHLREAGKTLETAGSGDLSDYFEDLFLYGPYEEVLEKITGEVFFILFLNRDLLFTFNNIISNYIAGIPVDDLEEDLKGNFKKDGVLKRLPIPKWVKDAVFYRDRGMCSNCHIDLTGQIRIAKKGNFDHIIPLAAGGINDITNIQLLCEKCNKSKRHALIPASKYYEKWY